MVNLFKLFILVIIYFGERLMGEILIQNGTQRLELGISCDVNLTSNIELNKINFYAEFTLPKYSINQINVKFFRDANLTVVDYGFSVIQVHSFLYNLTIWDREPFSGSKTSTGKQTGTNLGFVLFDNAKISERIMNKTLYLYNFNHFNNVTIAVIIVPYNKYAPVPGGCNLEGNIRESPILPLTIADSIINVDTPTASMSVRNDPHQEFCSTIKNNLTYISYYNFFPRHDFSASTYFQQIRTMIEASQIQRKSIAAVKGSTGPLYRRTYISVPGTGIVVNTIVKDANGNEGVYIPAMTYSCTPQFWDSGCTIVPNSSITKAIAIILIVIGAIRILIYYDYPTLDLFLCCLPIGMYSVYRINTYFHLKHGLIIPLGFVVDGIICILSHYSKISKCIFDFAQKLMIGLIIAVIVLYTTHNCEFMSDGRIYSTIFMLFAVAAIGCIAIPNYSILTAIFTSFLSTSAMITGIFMLTQSNMLLIILNHMNMVSIENFHYTNGIVPPTIIDLLILNFWFLIGFFGIIWQHKKIIQLQATIEEETSNQTDSNENDANTTPQPVVHYIHPIITRWTSGSDDVFESPNSNTRFLRDLLLR